jgi:hypothetical protein
MRPNLSAALIGRRPGLLMPTVGISGPVAQEALIQIRRAFRSFGEGRGASDTAAIVPQDLGSSNFQLKLTPLKEGYVTRTARSPHFTPPARVFVLNRIFSRSPCYRSRGPPRYSLLGCSGPWAVQAPIHSDAVSLRWLNPCQADLGGVPAPHR